MHCGLALLTLLLHVAGLFVLLNAEFLFAVQIIVYRAPFCALSLRADALNLKSDERYLHTKYAVMLFAAVAVCGELVLLIVQSPFGGMKGDAPAEAVLKDGASYAVGIKMFGEICCPSRSSESFC